MASLIAFLTLNWLPIVLGIAGVFLVYQNKDAIAAKLGVKGIDLPSGSDIIAQIQSLPLIQQLNIGVDDIKRAAESSMLIVISNRVDDLPEPDRTEGRSAVAVLARLIVQGPTDSVK
jgi:hypothetical protein